jgi:hypothetical protein
MSMITEAIMMTSAGDHPDQSDHGELDTVKIERAKRIESGRLGSPAEDPDHIAGEDKREEQAHNTEQSDLRQWKRLPAEFSRC